jgi:hypothetical protein
VGNLVGIVQLSQDLHAALVVGLPDLGETHFARASIEQANAEPPLKAPG